MDDPYLTAQGYVGNCIRAVTGSCASTIPNRGKLSSITEVSGILGEKNMPHRDNFFTAGGNDTRRKEMGTDCCFLFHFCFSFENDFAVVQELMMANVDSCSLSLARNSERV